MAFLRPRWWNERWLASFCSRMAGLTASGYPLPEGLRLMRKQCGKREEPLFDRLISGIEGGNPLSQLFLHEAFPPLMYSLMVVGEASGDLPNSFQRLSQHYEMRTSFRRDLWSASLYPLLVSITAILTFLFLMYVVLPQFELLYSQLGFPLPIMTQRLFHFAVLIRTWLPWLLLFFILIGCLLFLYRRKSPPTFHKIAQRMLHLPFIKEPYRLFLSYRLTENLSLLLSAGLPILQVLQQMIEAASLPYEAQMIKDIKGRILEGSTLSTALAKQTWIDFRVLLAVEIAEATGELSTACQYIARELSADLRTRSKRALQWFEPLTLLVIGGAVGGITLVMVLPMIELVQGI